MNWIDKVQEAIRYIENNLQNQISVESVAKEINYAPSSFSNLFSAITGYSVTEYIRFRRLSCAIDDLQTSSLSIMEIAFKYGYETPEAFSKAFKRLFDCSPSKYFDYDANLKIKKFDPISIDYIVKGGFSMMRNYIPGLSRVDWSDPARQNEFVNSTVSALNALGEKLDYDYVCAVSGSPFHTSFSIPAGEELWNHGNYHVIHTPLMIEHTFKMLGYTVAHHVRSDDYEKDKNLIMTSIDQGVPVITLEGVIDCSEACVVSGYDNNGDVLLGYNPFMYIENDHHEAHDDTGYFRKSHWHDGFCAGGSKVRILIIEGTCEALTQEEIFCETLKLAKRMIGEESLAPGQYNGLAAHRAFADALQNYTWSDNFEPYLNVMCNQKQYMDRKYAIKFFYDNGRDDLAHIYERIAEIANRMAVEIPQDFSASEMFFDKKSLKPYCDSVLEICKLEEEVLSHIDV